MFGSPGHRSGQSWSWIERAATEQSHGSTLQTAAFIRIGYVASVVLQTLMEQPHPQCSLYLGRDVSRPPKNIRDSRC